MSIYDHAISNGLGEAKATAAVLTFTDSYLSTLQAYVGNEKALLFEMTEREATGKLATFLHETDKLGSEHRMLQARLGMGAGVRPDESEGWAWGLERGLLVKGQD